MSEPKKNNDMSSPYMITVTQDGKDEKYYVAQVKFNDGKYSEQWGVQDKGYYLLVINVFYDKKNDIITDHNMFYSDMQLLVQCNRRSEKNFNLALELMEGEAKKSIEKLEEDRKILEDKGIGQQEIDEFLKIFKEEFEKESKKEETGLIKYEEPKKEEKKDKDKIMFKDVAGLEEVKEVLLDVIDQFNNPEKYERFDIEPIKSLLLYGEPGTGKTFIANAFANEVNAEFINISLGEIGSKYQNETGNNIRRIFQDARRRNGKVILYLDEIDSIAVKRGSSSNDKEKNNTLNVLLTEMSSEENENIFILCATNFYELLDDAFTRAGRIDVKIEIPLPNFETRLQILKLNTVRKPLSNDVDLEEIAEKMEGKNCADVALICNQSARKALKKGKDEIEQEDFLEVLDKMVSDSKKREYKKIGFDTKCKVEIND